MKEIFESWRQFTKPNSNKLNEGYTSVDREAEYGTRKDRARWAAAAATKKQAEFEASPEGMKQAKIRAIDDKLSGISKSLDSNEWDRSFLGKFTVRLSHKLRDSPSIPNKSDPNFESVLANVLSKAESVMRDTYGKWAAEGREKFKNDVTSEWWRSEGYNEYVVQPVEQIMSGLSAGSL